MKKILLLLLLGSYALSSFGIGIQQFYCCGKLKSTQVSFVQHVKEKCSKEEGMSDCCKTNFKSLKVKDSHFAADGIGISVKHFTELNSFAPSLDILWWPENTAFIFTLSHSPPGLHPRPAFILNCTYRI